MPPTPTPPGSRNRLILGVLALTQLLIWIDTTVLGAAFETLADPERGLGASPDELQWSAGSYTLVFATLMFVAGALGDRIGHRNMLVAGMVVFGAGSLWAAYPADAVQLVAARGVMGLGSALAVPATMALLTMTFTGEARARAFGMFSMTAGVGLAAGPVLAGLLLEKFWWGSVFLVNVPITITTTVAALLVIPNERGSARRTFDLAGPLLSVAALGLLAYGLIRAGQVTAWDRPDVYLPVVAGLLLGVVFVRVELRLPQPSFDPRLFRDRTFSAGHAALGLVFLTLGAASFTTVFYLQGVRGFSALEAGIVGLPAAAGVALGAPPALKLVRRFSVRVVCSAALAVTALCTGAFALFDEHTPIAWFAASALVQGLAIGMTIAPVTAAVMSGLTAENAGAGSAVNGTVRQGGSLLGIAIGGTVLSVVYRDRITPDLTDVPEPLRTDARVSAEFARHAAAAADRPDIAHAADHAFLHAMHVTAVGAMAVTLLGALVLKVGLPGERSQPPATASAPRTGGDTAGAGTEAGSDVEASASAGASARTETSPGSGTARDQS
ncbi:MFS transporter [Yinghuangia sp. ASG 101]|uniref:MFS transporter n=1 Tax=Yinghuangia sp. ASG 101 TaxID=2896848 RepID=UPI001E52A8FA|nr:MFS transporter [Yinghuangia sp. ASG 101]UGQ11958.1 MFS transporter [Yinghuangia sp. ASG 101]